MTGNDRPRFMAALAGLTSTLFGKDADKAMIRGYWMALRDLPIETVEAAMDQALRRCKWMPKPVEIRQLAGVSRVEERAATAWEKVLKLSSNCRTAHHSDPIAEDAVRKMGGWLQLGTQDAEELKKWGAKRFAELYEVLAESAETQAALNPAEEPAQIEDTAPRVRELVSGIAERW